ncbi:RAN GTPase-activating protein 1 [Diplonema papillatum]|nr:RAN GTPase-activating protein 1 [Diplonema papillatum]
MNEHEPDPENGKQYLAKYGVTHDNVTSLNLFLDDRQIGAEGALELARGLCENWSLTNVELRRSEVTWQGAVPLAQALVSNKTLLHLGLGRNQLTSSGGCHIAEALKLNQTLQSVDLEWNDLRDEAGLAIANMLKVNNSLLVLSLERNKLQRDACTALGAALAVNTKLRALNLGWNRAKAVGAISIADGLRKNKNLRYLNLAMNQIGVEGTFSIANALVENGTLESLTLQHNRMGDSIIMLGAAMRVNNTIRELNLESTQLNTEGVQLFATALQSNTSLEALNLSRNDLRNEAASALSAALRGKTHLRYIDLSSTNLTGAEPAAGVAELLESCPNLQTVLLEDNDLGIAGGHALAAKLQNSTPITCLNVSNCGLEPVGVKAIADALRRSAHLYLRSLQIAGNDAGYEAVVTLCRALQGVSSLVSLDLSGNNISDTAKEALCMVLVANPQLNYIFLNNSSLESLRSHALFQDEAHPYLNRTHGLSWSPPSLLKKGGDSPRTSSTPSPHIPSSNFASTNVSVGTIDKLPTAPERAFEPSAVSMVQPIRGTHIYNAGNTLPSAKGKKTSLTEAEANEEKAAREEGAAAPVTIKNVPRGIRQAKEVRLSGKELQLPVITHASLVTPPVAEPCARYWSATKASRLFPKPSAYQLKHFETNISEVLLTDDQLRTEFNRLDRNGNGYLEEDEFKPVFQSFDNYGVTSTEGEIRSVIRKHNRRGDGKITFDEYCIIMLGLARR